MEYSHVFQVKCSVVNAQQFRLVDKVVSVFKVLLQKSSLEVEVKGPVFLPKAQKLFTVNRSHHVFKKSREQFSFTFKQRLWVFKIGSVDSELSRESLVQVGSLITVLRQVPGMCCQWGWVKVLRISPFSLVVRTSPFRGGNTSSNLVRDTK